MAAEAHMGLSRDAVEGEEHPGGDRYPDGVVDKGPEEVLPDQLHGAAGQVYGLGQQHQVGGHQGNHRHVHRNVRPASHGDAHVGRGQGLGVVDPVAHHGYVAAFLLEVFDEFRFVVGHHRGLEMFDPGLGSDVGRSLFPSRR